MEEANAEAGGSGPPDRESADPGPGLPSLPRRTLMVVTQPVRLFEILRAHPVALGPLILGAVLVGIGAAMIPVEVLEDGIRQQMTDLGQDLEGGTGTMARVTWVMSIFGPLVFWPAGAAITAGVYLVIFRFLFGWEGRFRQYFSISAHAMLVVAIGTLLVGPLRAIAGDAQLSLSVGSFFTFLPEGLALQFLEMLDLFSLWSYVLLGMGVAVIDGEKPLRFGVTVSLGAALLVTLVIAAILA